MQSSALSWEWCTAWQWAKYSRIRISSTFSIQHLHKMSVRCVRVFMRGNIWFWFIYVSAEVDAQTAPVESFIHIPEKVGDTLLLNFARAWCRLRCSSPFARARYYLELLKDKKHVKRFQSRGKQLAALMNMTKWSATTLESRGFNVSNIWVV